MYSATLPISAGRLREFGSGERHRFTFPLAITALAFLSSYFQLFIFFNVAIAPWGDGVLFLENGRRILHGVLPYRDYLQFITPGIDLFYAAVLRVWNVSAWIPNLAMAILAAAIVLLTTLIATRFFQGLLVLIPGLLLTGFVFPSSLYATHHWFATAAVLGAILVLLDKSSIVRAIAAGFLCGIAVDFTQSSGALALLAFTVFLMIESSRKGIRRQVFRRCAVLWAGAGLAFLGVNGYFIWLAGVRQYLFCTVVFPLRYWGSASFGSWRILGEQFSFHMGLTRLIGFGFVYAVVPVVYAAWFLHRRSRPQCDLDRGRRELLVASAGLALFLAVVSAPSFLRLCTAAPTAVILLVAIVRERRPARLFLTAAACAALLLTIGVPARTQQHLRGFLTTPSGRIAFLDSGRLSEFRWVLAHTTEGQAFFGHAPASFAFRLTNPTPVNFMTKTDYTRPSEVAAIVRGLEDTRAPMLLLPADDDPRPPSRQAIVFRDYVTAHYQLAMRFASGDEAWLREDAGPTPPSADQSAIVRDR